MSDEERESEQVQGGSTIIRKVIGVIVILVVVGIGAGLSYLGKGIPDPWVNKWLDTGDSLKVVEVVAFLSFAINFLAYIPAFAFQTEKFYDLTGSLTYLACTAYSYAAGYSDKVEFRQTVSSALVFVWALRLGSFLFVRVLQQGKDDRFDVIKPNPIRFLVAWTIQGLWVFLTAFPVYVSNASEHSGDLKPLDIVGIAVWVIGFCIEVVADRQKSAWRKDPSNKGKFIETGLWYYSRHPNYFGEVVLWLGMFLLCCSSFSGTQWVTAISPVFVFCLIYFVSGVRLLEAKSDKKWGGQPDYENYKATTSVFAILPKLGKRVHSTEDQVSNLL